MSSTNHLLGGVSDPTETDDCTFPVRESSVDCAMPTDERGVSETYGRDHGQHEQPSLMRETCGRAFRRFPRLWPNMRKPILREKWRS